MAKLDPLTIPVRFDFDDSRIDGMILQKSIDEAFEAADEILGFANVLNVHVTSHDSRIVLVIAIIDRGRVGHRRMAFDVGLPHKVLVREVRKELYGCTKEDPEVHWAFEHAEAGRGGE